MTDTWVLHRRLPCGHANVRPNPDAKTVRRRCRVCGGHWLGTIVVSSAGSRAVGHPVLAIKWEALSPAAGRRMGPLERDRERFLRDRSLCGNATCPCALDRDSCEEFQVMGRHWRCARCGCAEVQHK